MEVLGWLPAMGLDNLVMTVSPVCEAVSGEAVEILSGRSILRNFVDSKASK